MNHADVLLLARAKLDTPEKWWRGDAVRDALKKHCVVTALMEAHGQNGHGDYLQVRALLERECGGARVSQWNDAPERTHAEVLAAFDRAIAAAEPQP